MNKRQLFFYVVLVIVMMIVGFLLAQIFIKAITASAQFDVNVCHATSSEDNPYNLNSVSVHSVDDARGLNGHGNHIEDAWKPFEFEGVVYPGQNEYLFGTVINDDCSLVIGTPTPTFDPFPTPTCCCPTETPKPEPQNRYWLPLMQKVTSCYFAYCAESR